MVYFATEVPGAKTPWWRFWWHRTFN